MFKTLLIILAQRLADTGAGNLSTVCALRQDLCSDICCQLCLAAASVNTDSNAPDRQKGAITGVVCRDNL